VTGGPWFVVSALMDKTPIAEVDFVRGTGDQMVPSVTSVPPNNASAPCVRWQDAAYADDAPAYYYARVIEAPSWRWTHYECQRNPAMKGCDPGGGLDTQVQQRAWTSPIWRLP
jgi:hypothetical protein